MAFFDELSKKISQTSQDVMKKTKDTAEVMKINGIISEEEKGINKLYQQIGMRYCELHPDSAEEALANLVDEVKSAKARVEEYSEQVNKLKGIVKCSQCGANVQYGAPFCSSCGTRMGAEVAATQKAVVGYCLTCGAGILEGMAFCTSCGTPVAKPEEELVTEPVVELVAEPAVEMAVEAVAEPVVEMAVEVVAEPVEEVKTDVAESVMESQVPVTQFCTSCGTQLEGGNAFCTNCGAPVGDVNNVEETEAISVSSAEVEVEEPVVEEIPTPVATMAGFCTTCGMQLGADDVFCTNCGTRVG